MGKTKRTRGGVSYARGNVQELPPGGASSLEVLCDDSAREIEHVAERLAGADDGVAHAYDTLDDA